VLGRDSLDQLTQWVVEKFSDIKNKNLPIPTFGDHPFTEKELKRQLFAKSIKDIRSLKLKWPFPDMKEYYEVKPSSYISHLIMHEGVGSILSLLKIKGWANGSSAGSSEITLGHGFFNVSINLTPSGLDNYQEIVKLVFQHIKLMKKVGVQEYIFRELQNLQVIKFRFLEKSSSPADYVSFLASSLHLPFKREWAISGPYLIRNYDQKLIDEILDLLRADNFTLTLVSPSFTDLDQSEKWYGTEYKVIPIDPGFIQTLQNLDLDPQLKIPSPNEFIPTNFEIEKKENVTPLLRPNLIKHTPLTRLWHKKDDTFWVPKACVYFMLNSPLVYASPLHYVKSLLYKDLVKDALREYAYDAVIASLYYNVNIEADGLSIFVRGFNDKISVLLEKILLQMRKFTDDPERFNLIKERIQRAHRNSLLDAPNEQAVYYHFYLFRNSIWTIEEKLKALENVTLQDVQLFYPELLAHLQIEALVHGNVSKDEALKLSQMVEDILRPKPLLPTQLIGNRSIVLPQGRKFVYQRDVYDANNINSAVEYYIQGGDVMDVNLKAKFSLMVQVSHEPCFDQLRTKEQLGYLVSCGLRSYARSLGMRIIVQSERDTVHLENRIVHFLYKLQAIIEEMPEEEYQKQVQSLITKKLEKPKNLSQEARRYWEHINSGYYDFDKVENEVSEIRKITKSDLLEFYKALICPSSPVQRKLSVHMRSQKSAQTKRLNQIEINDLYAFLIEQGLNIKVEELTTFFSSKELTNDQKIEDLLREFLVEHNKLKKDEIEDLIKNVTKLKSEKDERDPKLELDQKNELIEDVIVWKRNMKLGPTAIPVVYFSEFVSKL
ncbi:4609_t:CDS:10, partial [Acaulospora morrowiae]